MNSGEKQKASLISLVKKGAEEPGGFVDLVSKWNAYFRSDIEDSEMNSGFTEIESAAQTVLADRAATPPKKNAKFSSELPRLMNSFEHATFLVAKSGRINTTNRVAIERFGAKDGKSINDIGFCLEGAERLDDFVASVLKPGRNSTEPILKRAFDEDTDRPVCIAVVPASLDAGENSMALVFVIDPKLHDAAIELIKQEYSITGAESEILSAFSQGSSLQEIANERGRSPTTIRTQFQAILNKSGARSQAELLRNTMAISQFVGEAQGVSNALRHPNRKTSSVIRPGFRNVEITLAGDPNGTPVIFLPSITVYTFPSRVELAFRRAGLLVISICRPGIGKTDPVRENEDWDQTLVGDTLAIMDQIGIKSCPVVAHNSAAPFGFIIGREIPERISRLVVMCGFPPSIFNKKGDSGSNWVAAILRSAGSSPALRTIIVQGGIKAWKAMGTRKFVTMHLKGCTSDVEYAVSPDFMEEFEAAYRTVFAQGTEFALAEIERSSSDWSDLVEACDLPVTILHGAKDPIVDIASVRAFAAAFPKKLDLIEMSSAGYMLWASNESEIVGLLKGWCGPKT